MALRADPTDDLRRMASSATSLLLTVLGELVLPVGGSAWTATLVDVLGAVGVGERNARQALARSAEQGLLHNERVGRLARWHLSERATQLLCDGAERIYGFGRNGGEWDDHWLMVLCSVPEEQRTQRYQLKVRLAFLGFGFLSPGVAICPHVDRETMANVVLRELGLAESAVVLRAEAGTISPDAVLVERGWDLTGLAAAYEEFIATFERLAPRDRRAKAGAVVELVHAWRRFPFVDPEVPERLLPVGWPGHRARAVFDSRREAWLRDARAHVAALEASIGV